MGYWVKRVLYRYETSPNSTTGPRQKHVWKIVVILCTFLNYWHEGKSLFVLCVGMKQARYWSYPECDYAPLPFAGKLAIVTLVEAESET